MFFMKYHGGFSMFETYNLPIGLRKHMSEMLHKQLEREKEAMEKSSNSGKTRK